MYISLLLHLIKTHEHFSSLFYEKVGIVGGFEEKVGKNRIKKIRKVGKSRNSRKPESDET